MQKKKTLSSSSAWRIICLFALALLALFSFWDITSNTRFGELDFMGYWSSTYLLSNGENPYSADLMTAVQRTEIHSTLNVTIMSWNPPTLFVFLLPLTFMPFTVAKFVWLLINMIQLLTAGLLLTSIYMYNASPRAILAVLIFVLAFPAVISGLYMGQVTFLVFWGLIACVALIKKEWWFWAGAILILTTIKPHITILSVIYILIYMAKHRHWQGWVGLATTGVTCLTVLFLFRPGLIDDLQGGTVVAGVPWATATVGGLISSWGVTEAARYLIILFLPLPFLLVKYSEMFSVELSVALLTLITVPITFFGWSYDQTILLIPIVQVFAWLNRSRYKWPVIVCIMISIMINYYQRFLVINDTYYVWVPLFWWGIFGIVWRDVLLMDHHHAYSKVQSFIDYRSR